MKKLLPILILSALALAACGGGSNAVAATVNASEITVGDVEALISSESSAIPVETFAQFLGFEIQWQIVEVAAGDEYGIEIPEGEISAEADRIYEANNQGESREEFLSSRNVTEEFLTQIAHQGLIDIAVREAIEEDVPLPNQEEIDAEMDAAVANLTNVCVSHILVDTEDEAQDAYTRVTTGGEDFGEVAGELSTDPGSGPNEGVLPCTTAGTYVPEFRDASLVAPIGEVYEEIVESQYGFHIMLVTDREDPAEEDLPTEADVSDSLHSTDVREAANNWFFETVAAADVVVEAEYGTWNPNPPQPGVVPPAG